MPSATTIVASANKLILLLAEGCPKKSWGAGSGDIGDRVGDGQGVKIELRQDDGQAPRLMARFSG